MTGYIIISIMALWCALMYWGNRNRDHEACQFFDDLKRFEEATGHKPNDADTICLNRLGFDGYKAIGFDPSNAPDDVKRLIERL